MFKNLTFKIRMGFRIWMRNRTRPVTIEEAEERRLFWSKIYAVSGGLFFLYTLTSFMKNSSFQAYSQSLPIFSKVVEGMDDEHQIRMIKFSGFTKTSDITISKKDAYEMKNAEEKAKKSNSE